jgi:hypothetical protein
MLCEDPLVEWYRAQGYCVVRSPRDDVEPLLLLEGDRRVVRRIGTLADETVAGPQLPEVRSSRLQMGAVDRSDDLKVSVAIPILQGVLTAMGVAPSATVAYEHSRSLRFAVSDVEERSVELGAFYRYLEAAPVMRSTTVQELAVQERLFVITASLWARQINVLVTDGVVEESALEDKVLHGSVEVTYDRAAKNRVSYRGRARMAFAFKAVQLTTDSGRLKAKHVAGRTYQLRPGSPPPPALLRMSDQLIDLDVEPGRAHE